MALPSRIVNIPLVGGLTQKSGAVVLEAPSFAQLDNARFDKLGAIYQRHGFGKLTAETDLLAANKLATNGNALISLAADGAYSYQADRETWTKSIGLAGTQLSPFLPADVTVSDLPGGVTGIEAYDLAIGTDTGTPHCTVVSSGASTVTATIRAADGTLIVGPTALGGGSATALQGVRVVALGAVFYVMARDSFWGTIGWYCDTSAAVPAWSAGATVIAGATGPFDIEANTVDSEIAMAYWNGTNVVFARISTAFAVLSSSTTSHAVAVTFVSLRYDSGRLFAMYAGATGHVYGASRSADLATSYFTSQVIASVTGTQAQAADAVYVSAYSRWFLAWTERYAGSAATAICTDNISSTGTVASTVSTTFHVAQIGKMLAGAGSQFIPAQCTLSNGNLCGMLLQTYGENASLRLACGVRFMVDRCYGSGLSHLHLVFDSSGYAIKFAVGSYQGATAGPGGSLLRTRLALVGIGGTYGCTRFAEYDGVTYGGGGLLTAFDGQMLQESAPHWDPVIYSATAGSGGVLAAGDYSWKAVYEWEDARGVLHRSAPSPLITQTLTASQKCTLAISKLGVATRDGAAAEGVRIALYRTQVGGSVFYLVNPNCTLAAGSVDGYWDVEDATVTDANLGQILYTEGGFLGSGRQVPVWDMCLGGGRLWIISADRRSEVWFSKPLERTIAPEFDVSQSIDPGCGELTALARLDDKTVAFSRDQIFIIYGEGPNATGLQGGFAQPQPIASDTGCLSRDSVCVGPFGVVFHGKRGLCLLTRGLEVVPIGDDVTDLVSSNAAAITSAVLAPDSDEVRFTLFTGGTLIWNYTTNQWGRWTGLGTQLHAVAWDGKYIVCDGTSAVREYDTAKYGDDYGGSASGDELVARTGWISVSSIHGYQQVRRIYVTYTQNGVCGITVKARYDNSDTSYTLRTVAAADLAAAGELQIHVAHQRCERIQVQIESTGATAALGTLTIQALSLEIAADNGGGRYAATARR